MKFSRRQFLASLLLGGVVDVVNGKHVSHAATARATRLQKASAVRGISGYPLTLDSGIPRAAWSAAPGETVYFALSAEHRLRLDLHMQTIGGERVHEFGESTIVPQAFASDEPWLDGAGYAPDIAWTIPEDLASGVYFLNGLPDLFVNVRASRAALERRHAHSLVSAVLVPTNTINAYSTTEERSTYAHPLRVPVVSSLRPMNSSHEQNWLGTLRWLTEEPLFGEPRFLIDHDLEREDALADVELLVVAGHSEYWSRRAREAFDAHLARGGHVIVASGNVMWWQVRYEQGGERMVSYKDYDPAYGHDPEPDPLLRTVAWNSRTLDMPTARSIGGDFNRGGFGSHRAGLDVKGTGLRVADAHHPLFAGLELAPCTHLDFGGVREYDGAPIKGLDARGRPVADKGAIGAHRLEILGYEWTRRGDTTTLATAHLFQAEAHSGVVLHLGAPEASNGTAPGCAVMREVCHEFVRRLLSGQSPFADHAPQEVAFAMHTPWKGEPPPAPDCGEPPVA